jgi:hypothetical protein
MVERLKSELEQAGAQIAAMEGAQKKTHRMICSPPRSPNGVPRRWELSTGACVW